MGTNARTDGQIFTQYSGISSHSMGACIEKTAWGHESSMNYFLMENQNERAGIQSVVSNATKDYKLTSSDIDYHMLGTLLCNNFPCKNIRL